MALLSRIVFQPFCFSCGNMFWKLANTPPPPPPPQKKKKEKKRHNDNNGPSLNIIHYGFMVSPFSETKKEIPTERIYFDWKHQGSRTDCTSHVRMDKREKLKLNPQFRSSNVTNDCRLQIAITVLTLYRSWLFKALYCAFFFLRSFSVSALKNRSLPPPGGAVSRAFFFCGEVIFIEMWVRDHRNLSSCEKKPCSWGRSWPLCKYL